MLVDNVKRVGKVAKKDARKGCLDVTIQQFTAERTRCSQWWAASGKADTYI
jgi:hypothetical protein